MAMVSNYVFSFIKFVLSSLGILFSTARRPKLAMLNISPLTSFILALRGALVGKLVIQGILPLTSFTLALREELVGKWVTLGILSSIFWC